MIATEPLSDTDRRAAIRVSLDEPRDMFSRALALYARRTYGDVPDNALVLLKHRPALRALMEFERRVAKFDKLDPDLKSFALTAKRGADRVQLVSRFRLLPGIHASNDLEKLREVPRWRDSDVFTPTERRVLEYSEAMTVTPPTVSDEMVTRLAEDLGEPAFIELTLMVAIENERSRFNAALGLTSQGFSARCELPRD
jgi:alkylhydroperoxidase family enzyme